VSDLGDGGVGGAYSEEPLLEEAPVSRAERPRRRRINRWWRLVLTAGAVVVVLLLAAATWYELEAHALGPAGSREVVDITHGESFSSVAAALGRDKVIGSTLAFRISDVVHGTPTVQPGDYEFHQNETFTQVRSILGAGPNIYAVDVYSGLTLHEIATQVDEIPGHDNGSFALIAASGQVHSPFTAAGSDNLEGLLGTGQYLVLPGESDEAILTDMVQRFNAQAAEAGLTATSAAALGYTLNQVVTVASIVEKEGYIPKNMPDVARVIYNRLAFGTPLQMDSTVLYALGQDGGPVTPQDLQLKDPYNTYLNTGLTPTPICSPSVNALKAAVHPPPGSWFFFELVDKNGTEAFADTFAEQLANEKLAQSRGVG
jgi:UPF0755 protein